MTKGRLLKAERPIFMLEISTIPLIQKHPKQFSQKLIPPIFSDVQIISTAKGKVELFAKQFAGNSRHSILNPPPKAARPSIPKCPMQRPWPDFKYNVKRSGKFYVNLIQVQYLLIGSRQLTLTVLIRGLQNCP